MIAIIRWVMLLSCVHISLGAHADESWLAPQTIVGAQTIDASDIFDLAEKYDDLVVIDSRKVADYQKGHIEGAINVPDTETTEQSLETVLHWKNRAAVFYCNGIHCKRSSSAIKIAVGAGYTRLYWFRKGWDEWIQHKFPIVSQ